MLVEGLFHNKLLHDCKKCGYKNTATEITNSSKLSAIVQQYDISSYQLNIPMDWGRDPSYSWQELVLIYLLQDLELPGQQFV